MSARIRMGGHGRILVTLLLVMVFATSGATARLMGAEDGRSARHDALPDGVPPEGARNVTFDPAGCVSWDTTMPPEIAIPGVREGTCAPRPPTPWDTGTASVVAVARVVAQDDASYRFWSRVATLAAGEYALDAANTSLHLAFPVMPRDHASAIELVRPGEDPVLVVFEHVAHLIGGPGGVDLPYWHSPGSMLMLTPAMLRWENHFTEGCPSVSETDRGTFRRDGAADHGIGVGESMILRFAGAPDSSCPPATFEAEHLGLWNWKVDDGPRV